MVRSMLRSGLVHRQPMLLLASASMIGVLVDAVVGDAVVGGAVALWASLTIGSAAAAVCSIAGRAPLLCRMLAVLLMVLPLAALRHRVSVMHFDAQSLRRIATDDSEPCIVEGIVVGPSEQRRRSPGGTFSGRRDQDRWQTRFRFRVTRIKSGDKFRPVDGTALCTVDGALGDGLFPGDRLRVFGLIQKFLPPSNPGEQDHRRFYHRRGLHVFMDIDSENQIVRLGQSTSISRWIAKVAASSREQLLRHVDPALSPLAMALVLGQREFLSDATRDQLLVTGTAHLLSVSGLHLAIIATLAHAISLLLRMPRLTGVLWILGACLLYTAVTGARPPVVRAAILIATLAISGLARRPRQSINTLSMAALVLVFWNPALIFSTGVQLSFVAVTTLMLSHRSVPEQSSAIAESLRIESQLKVLVDQSRSRIGLATRLLMRRVRHLTWISICVAATSMPLVWYRFHVVSPVSCVTNVALSPCMFVALASGVATIVTGPLGGLGWLFGMVCSAALMVMRWMIDVSSAVPLGHRWLPSPPGVWVAMFYPVLVVSLYIRNAARARVVRCLWVLLWATIAWYWATTPTALRPGWLEATFVDVGHGTCVILRMAPDEVWLYDCGKLGNFRGSSREIESTLWSLGVTRISRIYLSHADSDHFNALPGILRRFEVGEIITTPEMLADPQRSLDAIRQAIAGHRSAVREVCRHQVESFGNKTIRILHPPCERIPGSDNANSIVMQIEVGGRTLILPGDLEPPGTGVLINNRRPEPGGLLMAPHHGSLRMEAPAVLAWARPRETIVSGGNRARRPEVTELLSITGSDVHVTSELGAIRLRINPAGQFEVRSWTRSPW